MKARTKNIGSECSAEPQRGGSATGKHVNSASNKHAAHATSKHIDSATSKKLFGLIGHPIDHSLSPALFREAFPDSPNAYDLIQTPDFEEAYSIFLDKYDAVNVTAPFKELAFQRADSHEASCSIIGAANLLIKDNGQVKAYNTDMTAVMRCLWRGVVHQINSKIWPPEKATGEIRTLVIGAGGAGKAAAVACLNLGFKTAIANRTRPRTFDFIDRISAYRKNIPEAVDFLDLPRAIAHSDIIIYTIPALIPDPTSTSVSLSASHSSSLAASSVPSAALLRSDLSGKILLEANYRTPSIPAPLLPQTALYLDGTQWLREQALATWHLL